MLNMTREQLQQLGPIRSTPKPKDPRIERDAIERQINDLRELAMLGELPAFKNHVGGMHTKSLAKMLYAASDDERRSTQAMAQAWAKIYSDTVTAKEQVQQLTERLEAMTRG